MSHNTDALYCDAPGKHHFELLKKLVLPDGSILRARLPGRPTRDCLFNDPARDSVRAIFSREVSSMATVRNLKIKTNTCKRIVKELQSYEKEVEREAAKTAGMKEKGADPYDLKQQVFGCLFKPETSSTFCCCFSSEYFLIHLKYQKNAFHHRPNLM